MKDLSPTGTFLDRALFTKIAAKRKEGFKQKLVQWIRDCITAWDYENNVPSVCLDSLVQQGILGKERKLAGMCTDYPTKNPGKQKHHIRERLRVAFTTNGKRQKLPRDHDLSSFAVYRLLFLKDGQ